jgi:hypothetical protein
MRNDIRNSCIAIPVPTDLYVSMRDLLSNSNMECGPALKVASMLDEYPHGGSAERLAPNSGAPKTVLS